MNPDKDYISEPEFQDFFSLTPDLLCISDVDGNFIKINSAWHETLGYSEEELLSNKIYSFVHPDDLQSTKFAMKDLTNGKEIFNFVNRYRNKEGNYKYIEWRARPKGRYIYSAARDITERIISEKYIQESQTILDMFFSQSLTGFFFMMLDEPVFWNDTVDKEKTMDYVFAHHRITKINQAMLDQYGAKKEEFIGLTPNDLFSHELVHGRKTWMDFFDQGRLHVETREKKLDGTPIYILGDYLCLYDEQGRITGHFGVQTDITNLKQAQEDLITAKQLAEEASEAKSRFLANMSHEIRTPLNGVIGFTDLLGNTDLTPIQLQYVENANISGHTLLGIINDILDFSKIEAGMMELDLVRSDLIEIVENSIDLIKFQAGKKNIEILLNIDNQLPQYALLDAIRLKQVLANLLSNAIKFTLAGEVELKIKYIPMSPGRGQLKFSVRDTGIGINENDKIKIFKAFTQIDSQPTREFGGTGLGLVISDMIVRKMGSTIKIDSKVGEGSTFYFDIETEVYSEKTQLDLRNSEIKNCLLVDDSKANIDILRDKFQFWGIPTDFCYDGNSALNMLKKKAYDLIICDYHMPNMNGIDLIRKIRYDLKLTSEKQAILLLHSSSDDIEIYNDCLELDVSYRLTKPVKFGKLHEFLLQFQSGSDGVSVNSNISEENKFKNNKIDPAANISETDQLQENQKFASIKILLVEDNELNLFLIKSILNKLFPSADIKEAGNGAEAVFKYKENTPDIILMDIQMPIMDGIAATKEIRKLEKDSNKLTPIIALTAGALKEEQIKCFHAGMNGFLTKPIDRNKIQNTIIEVLSKDN